MLKQSFDLAIKRAESKTFKRHSNILSIILSDSVSRGQQLPNSDVDVLAIIRGSHIPKPIVYYDTQILVGIFFVSLRRFQSGTRILRNSSGPEEKPSQAKSSMTLRGLFRILRKRRTLKPPRRITDEIIYDSCFNILEYLGKLRNGSLVGDEYLTRNAARVVAQHAENILVALNDISPVSENKIWHQVMKARIKPSHLIPDYPIALGIRGRLTRQVFLSALRLGRETLELVKNTLERYGKSGSFLELLEDALRGPAPGARPRMLK